MRSHVPTNPPTQVCRCMLQHKCGVEPDKWTQKLLGGLLYISHLTVYTGYYKQPGLLLTTTAYFYATGWGCLTDRWPQSMGPPLDTWG